MEIKHFTEIDWDNLIPNCIVFSWEPRTGYIMYYCNREPTNPYILWKSFIPKNLSNAIGDYIRFDLLNK